LASVANDVTNKKFGCTKVFVFPSVFEGFGTAMTEAHAAGLSVVAWRLPVFEERFCKESVSTVELVKRETHRSLPAKLWQQLEIGA